MDQHLINTIVFLLIAGIGAMMKKSSKQRDTATTQDTENVTANPQVMTEADRRYREVQEEIRRRLAQRNQGMPMPTATATPNPLPDYQPSKKITIAANLLSQCLL